VTSSPQETLRADADASADAGSPLRGQPLSRVKSWPRLSVRNSAFLVANAALWVVWSLTGAGYPWPVWVTVAWGIGLLVNAWAGIEIRRDIDHPRSQ
jgi:hypothetical protein